MCMGRLVQRLDINICGFFDVNLKSLFKLISEIVMLTIVLIQIQHRFLFFYFVVFYRIV